MKTSSIARLLLAIAVAGTLGAGNRTAWAQGQESSSSSSSIVNDSVGTPGDVASPDSANAEPPAAVKTTQQYAVALNSDRLIQLGAGPRFQPLYWSDFTEAYDNRLSGGPTAGSVSVWVPTVGFTGHTQRSDYLFQYSATVSEVNNPASNLEAYHNGTFIARGNFTRDWAWDISLASRYGVDQLRLFSGLSYGAFGGVPVVNSNAAATVLGAQPILNTDESLGLHWQMTERNRLSIGGYHSYYSVLSVVPNHTNRSGFTADFARSLSRRVAFHAYESNGYTFGIIPCTFVSTGIGLDVTPSERLSLQLRGGPTFGSLRCATRRGENYDGLAAYHLSATSSVYLSAVRLVNSAVLLPRPQTQDSFSGGYARQVARNVQLRLDGGYVRIDDGVIVNSGSGHGYFVSPQAQWQFARSFSLLSSYRHVYQRYGLASLGRNQVLITLEWRPQPRGLYK